MRIVTILAVILLSSAALGQEVYRAVDAEGNPIYTDRPITGTEEAVTIEFVGTPAGQNAPAPAEELAVEAGDEVSPEVAAEATAAQQAEDRARNCAIARDNNSRYDVAHRLYRVLPDGEREYLDDAEIDAARAKALVDIETWCD